MDAIAEFLRGMKGDYPPDRTAAGLGAAFTVGMGFLQILEIGRAWADPRYGSWLEANRLAFVLFALESAFVLWLCAGWYGGRRWAFWGTAFFVGEQCVRSSIFGGYAQALVQFAAMAYVLLRLTTALGPSLVAPKSMRAFPPDRLFGVASAAINAGIGPAVQIRNWPGGWQPNLPNLLWIVFALALNLWVNLGFFQSRGWAVVAGFFLATLGTLSLVQLGREPLYMAYAAYSALYAAVRLAGFGPKVEGPFGLRSS